MMKISQKTIYLLEHIQDWSQIKDQEDYPNDNSNDYSTNYPFWLHLNWPDIDHETCENDVRAE